MRQIAYILIFLIAATDVLVIHTLQADDEQRQAEAFAEWYEAHQDEIAEFNAKSPIKESI